MTTNNHPANGPVSLDRLHQIREHLLHDTQYSNGGNRAYILADMLRVIEGAIAAFDAEPVFFIEVDGDDWIQAGRIPGSTFDFNNLPDGVNKLWAAPQPAPVVPGEKPMPEASKMHALDAVAAIAEVRGWNACRAAMLQAGSHLVIGIDRESGPDRTWEVRYCAPPGYVMVPVEPTEKMVIEGFESEPDEFFSKSEEWDAYQEMSGCEQAAHRAKLCWAAMIKAAPKQENI